MAYCTIQELAAALGIAVTAANTPDLTGGINAAAREIDHVIDVSPTVTPYWTDEELGILRGVNLARGVEWFKAPAAAFGVIGYDQTGAIRAPTNGFARYARALTPLKQQFGVA